MYKCLVTGTDTNVLLQLLGPYMAKTQTFKEKSKYNNLARLDPAVYYIQRSECALAMPEAGIHKWSSGRCRTVCPVGKK